MSRTYYSPDTAPDPKEWLALPEQERQRVVQNHHVQARVKVPNLKLHSAMHVVVENQLAGGYGPSKCAVERLQSEGLTRHDAVHAIASVVSRFVFELLKSPTAEQQASHQSRMGAAIDALTAATWLSDTGTSSDG